jgi:hypothetical protein
MTTVRLTLIPATASGGRVSWFKNLTGVDLAKKNGYAFQGDFLEAGKEIELEIGSIVIEKKPIGSIVIEKKPIGSLNNGYYEGNIYCVAADPIEDIRNPHLILIDYFDWRKAFLSFRDLAHKELAKYEASKQPHPASLNDLLLAATPIVQRTAQYGLNESLRSDDAKAKWLMIWVADAVAEYGEYIQSHELVEVGDCLWGLTAVCLLIGITEIDPDGEEEGCATDIAYFLVGCELLDIAKKVLRDGVKNRPIDQALIIPKVIGMMGYLSRTYDSLQALRLLDAKLLKRYPDGYSAEASVNRA